jgi:hypothetical protein
MAVAEVDAFGDGIHGDLQSYRVKRHGGCGAEPGLANEPNIRLTYQRIAIYPSTHNHYPITD